MAGRAIIVGDPSAILVAEHEEGLRQPAPNRVTVALDLDIHSVISFKTHRIYLPLVLKGWKGSEDQG